MVEVVRLDSNSYRVFKTVDQSLLQRISREFDISANRRLKTRLAPYITASIWLTNTSFMPSEPCASVGALTKAICCTSHSHNILVQPHSRTWISTVSCILLSHSVPLKTPEPPRSTRTHPFGFTRCVKLVHPGHAFSPPRSS